MSVSTLTTSSHENGARNLYLWLIAGIALVLAARVGQFGSWSQYYFRLHSFNIFVWGAIAVVAWRLLRMNRQRQAEPAHYLAAVAICVAMLAAAATVVTIGFGFVFLILGLALLWLEKGDENARAAGLASLALATNLTIAPFLFRAFLHPILMLDATLMAGVLKIVRPDMIWYTATTVGGTSAGDLRVNLIGACSSFGGVSAAVLVHMAWAMYARTRLTRFDAIAICATACVIIALNVTRLVLASWNWDMYNFWHGQEITMPIGAAIFTVLDNVVIIGAGFFSATWAGRAEK